ncbi:MAG: glutamate--tRNA ligase [Candidatus Shikimatogenerans sp. AspAUS03]|uniref:Glutamate--tRNA ligase family protein n=1 Tax=Candidatus Shikimatogenerans sp. AspAUS03 TaxID=3158563 RepID=A0AAU7QSY3_9FLAO
MFKNFVFRFAPSPSGPLHIGNIRILIYNYILYKKYKGKLYLRIDNTNKKKNKSIFIKYIFKTFKWLLNYKFKNQYIIKQLDRLSIYKKYINILLKKKIVYLCYDTKIDINNMKKIYKKNNKKFYYSYKTRKFMNNKFNKIYKKKKKYVIRYFNIPNKIIYINDLIYGRIIYNSKNLTDIILYRSNGIPTYYFTSIIDDYLLKISHIIRGKEWLSTTALHILIYKVFKWPIPYFIHVSNIIFNNKKISKSNINNLKNNIPFIPIKYKKLLNYQKLGYLPLSIINYLLNNDFNKIYNLKQNIKKFKISKIKKNNILYEIKKILFFNKIIIQNLSTKYLIYIYKKLLKKKYIKYKNFNIKKILFIIKNRLFLLKDLLKETLFIYKIPIKYYFNIKYIKKINYIINKLIFYFLKKKYFIIINLKKIYIKVLRLIIIGKFQGLGINLIFKLISKNEILKRLLYFKKFILNLNIN